MKRAVDIFCFWFGFVSVACGGDPSDTKATGALDAGTEAATGGSNGGQPSGGGDSGGVAGAQSGGSAGVDDGGGNVDAGVCGPNLPFNPPSAECGACALGECCAQKEACGANPECVALRQCGGKPGCSSGPCWEECLATHPDGVSDANAFAACLQKDCYVQCGLSPPPPCGMTLGLSASCEKCANDLCCSELSAASGTPDFWDWVDCTDACGPYNPFDTTCLDKCAVDHPSGSQQWGAIATCYNSSCQNQC